MDRLIPRLMATNRSWFKNKSGKFFSPLEFEPQSLETECQWDTRELRCPIINWVKVLPGFLLAKLVYFFLWVAHSGPLLFYDHRRSVFLNLTNLLIFANFVRWFPLSPSLLPLLSISFGLFKIDGTWRWKNWIVGTRQRRDLNSRPPDLIHDELDHRTMVPYLLVYVFFVNDKNCTHFLLTISLYIKMLYSWQIF